MPLVSLEVHNVRIIDQFASPLHPLINVITGANASGKTSFLEALYLLGTGKSFRAPQTEHILRHTTEVLTVFGRYQDNIVGEVSLGIQRSAKTRRIKVGDTEQKNASALAQTFPVQAISPDSYRAFLQEAGARRALLNWGLFHVEPEFNALWERYRRLLKQRNAALRARQLAAIWDKELVQVGEQIHELQTRYCARWGTAFQEYGAQLMGPVSVRLGFKQGWSEDSSLAEALRRDHGRDTERGITHSGPHRTDIQIQLEGQALRHFGSHGQQKLIVIALKLAHAQQFMRHTQRYPAFLIDDLAAELDREHGRRLLNVLAQMRTQVFITAIETQQIEAQAWNDYGLFHVEQGRLQRLK